MYSMILFIVLLSDQSFFGSGSTPRSAEDRIRQSSSSLTRPVKVHSSATPTSSAYALMLGWWGPPPTSTQWMSSRPNSSRSSLHRPHQVVDPVLLADLAEVDEQVALALAPGRVGWVDGQALEVGTGAHHVHVAGRLPAPLDRDPPVALVGGDHQVGRLERLALQEPQPGQRPARPRSRTWPGTSRARGRGGRTGTACRTASRSEPSGQ